MSGAAAETRAETKYMARPVVKTFFAPRISAILPNGMRNEAAVRKKAAVTHPRRTTSAENSCPIAGVATMIAATMKGATEDPRPATSLTIRLLPEEYSSAHTS